MFDDERQYRAFGIPVHEDWVEIVRQAHGDIRVAIKYGTKDLTTEWLARVEVINLIADKLREQGVPEPIKKAWELVGDPTEQFHDKLKPGQPLGDLEPGAVLAQFKQLILSRLKYYKAADNKDGKSAAQVGLLNALADYDPAVDSSVGWFAKAHYYIDNEIKYALRGKKSDAWYHDKVSSDDPDGAPSVDQYSGEGQNEELYDVMPGALLPDQIANAIELAHDHKGRFHLNRFYSPYFYCDRCEVEHDPKDRNHDGWMETWAELSHAGIRREAGPREEDWMDLPCMPQEMADALARVSSDKVVAALARLDGRSQEIVAARFRPWQWRPIGPAACDRTLSA